jgi:hypothetical protein
MGCDIHMFVEKKNPNTGRWEKLDSVFIDDHVLRHIKGIVTNQFGLTKDESDTIILNYFKGVKPKNKWESYIYNHIEKSITDDPNFPWWKDTSKFPLPYTDQPYTGRNYDLYGALAGVRNPSMELISGWIKGLPDDVSDTICRLSDDWGSDGHSHNYFTVKELLDSNYHKMSDEELDTIGVGTYFFRNVVNSLLELGDPEDVRIVFWFDN